MIKTNRLPNIINIVALFKSNLAMCNNTLNKLLYMYTLKNADIMKKQTVKHLEDRLAIYRLATEDVAAVQH